MSHCVQRNAVRVVAFNKCGHTSIINSFQTASGNAVLREKPDDALKEATLVGDYAKAATWPEPIVTIAFFRHPLARVASVWNHLIRDFFYLQFKAHGFTRDMPFEDFCKHLISIRDEFLDPHLEEQAINFRACRGLLNEVEIYRLDEISTSWPQMVSTWDVDCTVNIAHMNRRDYPGGLPWTDMYHHYPMLARQLLDVYAEDLEIWRSRALP